MTVGRQQPDSFDSQSRHEGRPIPPDKMATALVRVVHAYFALEPAQAIGYASDHVGVDLGRRPSISRKMSANSFLETATSAIPELENSLGQKRLCR